MSLVRWEPFRDIYSLQEEMNRLFNETFAPTSRRGIDFAPSAELEETDEAYTLKLEVPGLEAKDINIEVTEDSVSVSGERKSETKSEQGGITRTEFQYGSFRRVVPLPGRIDNNTVKADYKDGILSLNLPKLGGNGNGAVKVSLH
ncbi:Hsp20/alpha crystallin family protein [Synechococcus sp. PCC 7336]|uniref:Hsp20/alpha crystallin family protein n=1 Tax=Synechococcus sp. PCC 7336 TaxID=195250 RepID=UPI000346F7FB|nr:Hsp20/alpha crystallin family protein [Synechococcus sp. PCC 7336]